MAPSFPHRVWLGLRSSARSNAAVYGYSVMITASFGALQVTVGSLSLRRIFLFLGGAAVAFAVVELAVSRGGRARLPEEPSDVVVLGSALGLVSITAAVGAAALVGELVGGWLAWWLSSFGATVVYLLVVALELAVAHQIEDRRR